MNFAGRLLSWAGWSVDISVPDYPKAVICVAPHTSNWDFVLGKLAYASVGRKAGFLMKSSWFFFPLGIFFRHIGGVPVVRGKGPGGLVEQLVERFNASPRLVIAITPEGTRGRNSNWHSGFLRIAYEADIPVELGVIDAEHRRVLIKDTLRLSGDMEADMAEIKNYYRSYKGIHPEKFAL